MNRFWIYDKSHWDGPSVYFGGDEYGRRTIVLRITRQKYVVFAYWTCKCKDCNEMRTYWNE